MLYPNGIGPNHDHEATYVQAYVDLLPTPWRGFMMAGFAAAYMSTVGTQLNWGASYLVNDFYRRFLNKTASDKHYVTVSRWATVILFLLSVIVTSQIDTVGAMWELLLALGSGTGLVLILRWYWWRINAWSEISAMIASFVVSITALTVLKARLPAGSPLVQSYVMLITVGDEHGRVAVGHIPDRARARSQARGVLSARAAGRPRMAPDLGQAGLRPARRSPVARWPGPTGWRASWRCTPACSGSARSSSASSGRG